MILPPLIVLQDFNGNWEKYEEEVYRAFCNDLMYSPFPRVNGESVYLNRNFDDTGRIITYSHVTSAGPDERSRTPDLRRCERIRWIRVLLDSVGTPHVVAWENIRQGGRRGLLVALPDFSYLVVLRRRSTNGYLLITTYTVEHEHRRLRFAKEYRESVVKY